jgi:hypothetical protein
MNAFRLAGAIAAVAMTLAGCAGAGLSPSVEEAPPAPNVAMAGRWMLSAPAAPSCGMRFTQANPQAGATGNAMGGSIAPEGGCPGNFFTSRHWAFESGRLVIRDHNSEPLAQLAFADGHFTGQSTAGMPVTLTRPTEPARR